MKRHGNLYNKIISMDNGEKVKITDIVDKEIVITGGGIRESHFQGGDYLTLQFTFEDKQHVCFTGSKVLIDTFKKYQSEIPFITTIRKDGKMFQFT